MAVDRTTVEKRATAKANLPSPAAFGGSGAATVRVMLPPGGKAPQTAVELKLGVDAGTPMGHVDGLRHLRGHRIRCDVWLRACSTWALGPARPGLKPMSRNRVATDSDWMASLARSNTRFVGSDRLCTLNRKSSWSG